MNEEKNTQEGIFEKKEETVTLKEYKKGAQTLEKQVRMTIIRIRNYLVVHLGCPTTPV